MSVFARLVMQKLYGQARGRPERLPWHQDSPPRTLARAVAARGGRGRALDVGCGAGVFTAWLAEQGMEVVGLDLFPEATAMARTLAEERRVRVEIVCADLFRYAPARPFDLVLDSGCLHSLVGGGTASYKRQLLGWLAPGADYVLSHWTKRHAVDWRPIGPRRRTPATIERMLAPELEPVEREAAEFTAPLPIGPRVRGASYWFRRC